LEYLHAGPLQPCYATAELGNFQFKGKVNVSVNIRVDVDSGNSYLENAILHEITFIRKCKSIGLFCLR